MKINKNILKVIGYLALAYLIYIFLFHGFAAIKQTPGFISMIMSLGFSFSIAKFLLYVVGIVDLIIAYALYAYRNDFVLVYAALWPIIPGLISFSDFGVYAFVDILISPLAAVIVYYGLGFNFKNLIRNENKKDHNLK